MKRLFSILLCVFLLGLAARLEAVPYLWRLVGKIHPKFNTYHTQGMVKIGNRFYLSAVETQKDDQGVGHFFEIDEDGNLLRQTVLGEGKIFHPGGIDYDGNFIWVPVAEYKPRSQSIIYRIDPKSLKAEEMFRVSDHIGAIVFNRDVQSVVGMNWDARAFYEWSPAGKLIRKVLNDVTEFSYQDCKYLHGPAMLCSGTRANANGGLALVDLLDFDLIQDIQHIPRTSKKILMTRNPMAIEMAGDKIRYYFMPEDRDGDMYIFEIW